MSSKSISSIGIEISGMQKVLESMSSTLRSVQRSNAVATAVSTRRFNDQLFDTTQYIREAIEHLNQVFNSFDMIGLRESVIGIPHLMESSSVIEADIYLKKFLKSSSLQMNLGSTIPHLNLEFDSRIFETIQRLSIDTSVIEKEIQNNLKILSDVDWSLIIETEDFEGFTVENSLDVAVIDFDKGVPFQEQIADFINRYKTKNPIFFILIAIFVFSPVQAAIDDAVRNLVKEVTSPIVEQAQTNEYRAIEKNMKIEVNNTLIINIESKDVRDEFMKIYGYVSTDKLIMRQTNKVNSRALYALEFGQVIKIIHKDRNWSLVEYEREEEVIKGWVFTRYISKFKK